MTSCHAGPCVLAHAANHPPGLARGGLSAPRSDVVFHAPLLVLAAAPQKPCAVLTCQLVSPRRNKFCATRHRNPPSPAANPPKTHDTQMKIRAPGAEGLAPMHTLAVCGWCTINVLWAGIVMSVTAARAYEATPGQPRGNPTLARHIPLTTTHRRVSYFARPSRGLTTGSRSRAFLRALSLRSQAWFGWQKRCQAGSPLHSSATRSGGRRRRRST